MLKDLASSFLGLLHLAVLALHRIPGGIFDVHIQIDYLTP
jgi:hypothetical protein